MAAVLDLDILPHDEFAHLYQLMSNLTFHFVFFNQLEGLKQESIFLQALAPVLELNIWRHDEFVTINV